MEQSWPSWSSLLPSPHQSRQLVSHSHPCRGSIPQFGTEIKLTLILTLPCFCLSSMRRLLSLGCPWHCSSNPCSHPCSTSTVWREASSEKWGAIGVTSVESKGTSALLRNWQALLRNWNLSMLLSLSCSKFQGWPHNVFEFSGFGQNCGVSNSCMSSRFLHTHCRSHGGEG